MIVVDWISTDTTDSLIVAPVDFCLYLLINLIVFP